MIENLILEKDQLKPKKPAYIFPSMNKDFLPSEEKRQFHLIRSNTKFLNIKKKERKKKKSRQRSLITDRYDGFVGRGYVEKDGGGGSEPVGRHV